MLSIIIPTFNEMKNGYIQKSFPRLAELKDTQIICVDFHSSDNTQDLIKQYGFTLLTSDHNSRAERLNQGIKTAKGQLVLLHHPRSLIDIKGLQYLIKNQSEINYWGAFTHRFDLAHPLLKFTSFWSNYIRGDLRGIFYLDHCIFAPKELLEKINYLPNVDIFEDTLLSLNLKKVSHYKRLPYESVTSAIRFKANGVWNQAILNQKMKWQFYFNAKHNKMNKSYEYGLNLNSDYKSDPEKDTKNGKS